MLNFIIYFLFLWLRKAFLFLCIPSKRGTTSSACNNYWFSIRKSKAKDSKGLYLFVTKKIPVAVDEVELLGQWIA